MKDEILDEAWKAKDSLAAKYHHDVVALAAALRGRERRAKAKVVDLHARRQTVTRHVS